MPTLDELAEAESTQPESTEVSVDDLVAQDPSEKGRKRSESLAVSRKAKMDELYSGKSFTIEGEVHLDPGKHFTTKLGNKGRHGWIIIDDATGEKQVVGQTTLELIATQYGAVVLPEKPARGAKADAEDAAE